MGPRALTAVAVIAALALWWAAGLRWDAPRPLAVGALAGGYLLAEAVGIHSPIRRAHWTFGFSELPLAAGLLAATPSELVLGHLLGYGTALVAVRRVEGVKVAFNLATGTLATVVAIVIVETTVGSADRLEDGAWLVVLLALVASAATSATLIALVIRALDPSGGLSRLGHRIGFALLVALGNGMAALTVAVVIERDPTAAVLAVLPAVGLFAAYRAHLHEDARRDSMESLYVSSRQLTRRGDGDDTVPLLVREVAAMFRATTVEVLLRSTATGTEPVRVVYREGEPTIVERAGVGDDEIDRLAAPVPDGPVLVSSREPDPRFAQLLEPHGATEAMIGRLLVGDQLLGLIVAAGPLSRAVPFGQDDLRLFGTLVHQAASAIENGRLEVAITEMREIERRLAHEALTDPLTGLANRARLTRALDALHDGTAVHAVALVDLDDFKAVNDARGHAAGDAVLIEVARRLCESVRSTDLVARLGGDEFAILFSPGGDPEAVARRIVVSLAEPVPVDGEGLRVGASIGLARVRQVDDPDRLLRAADAAMYAAKSAGKGRVTEFTTELAPVVSAGAATAAAALELAARQGLLDLHLQPVIDLRDGHVVAAEGLARWHVDGRERRAAEFVDDLTAEGLVGELDLHLFERTRELLPVVAALGDGAVLGRNVSPVALRPGGILERIARELDEAQRVGLALEIPVAAALGRSSGAQLIAEVKALGVGVVLDGVGGNDGGLPLLASGAVDVMKVDIAHLSSGGGAPDVGLLTGITRYAHAMEIRVVAKGIERAEQLEAARAAGCDAVQGRLVAPPLRADALVDVVGRGGAFLPA